MLGGLLVEPVGSDDVTGFEALKVVVAEGPNQIAGLAKRGSFVGVVGDPVASGDRMKGSAVGEDSDPRNIRIGGLQDEVWLDESSETCGRSDHFLGFAPCSVMVAEGP